MLYDPKWEKQAETKADQKISLAGFISWLEKQPAFHAYGYMPCATCAIGQYAASLGKEYSDTWKELGMGTIADWNIHVTAAEPHTFGAALERARKFAASA